MDKEVRFDVYCKSCEHYSKSATDDPCNHCLGNPSNEDSKVPVDFKKAKYFINYLTPEPSAPTYTRERNKSVNWIYSLPTQVELQKYFTKDDNGDYWERKDR